MGMLPFYEAVPGPGATMSGATNANSGGMLFQNVAIDGSGARLPPRRRGLPVRITPTTGRSASPTV